AELARRKLLDESVLVTQTGCMFPCNRAPLVVVYPDNEWYESLAIEDISWFVDRLEAGKDERTGPLSWPRAE
ncbi:MAG: (2Fe-2S) ferredoxin domain-containing protein, partial [Propionibacteriaceae bacterium]